MSLLPGKKLCEVVNVLTRLSHDDGRNMRPPEIYKMLIILERSYDLLFEVVTFLFFNFFKALKGNRPFLSCFEPHHESEASWIVFIHMQRELNLAFVMRFRATQN